MADSFDVLIIGAGPGGYVCAHRALQHGLSVAVAEEGPPGGVCLNVGCIPTKGLLYGPHGEGMGERVRHNQLAVERLRKGVDFLLKGAERISGCARLKGPGVAEVDGMQVRARHIVIATGSRPRPLPGLPFDGKRVLSSDDAVALESAPASIAIIGAGAVGCEFAEVFESHGSRVSLFEMRDRLVPELDPWLSKQLDRAFKKRGIEVHTGAAVDLAELDADAVLVAVGRDANVEDLGLETVGLSTTSGFIAVDGHGRTGVDGVWAIGDVTGPPQLAHRASRQGEIVADCIAGKNPAPLDPLSIPACVYTHPQLAQVGRVTGDGLRMGESFFRANGYAVVTDRTDGGVRLFCDADGKLTGALLAGPEVAEMVGLLNALIGAGVTVGQLSETVFPHPTLAEMVWEAARVASEVL